MEKQHNVVEYQFEASEFQWEIAPGKIIAAWGFNGQVPGPVLKARKGDTLVVKLKNSLSEPTMIHWHGIRLPASMDGTGKSKNRLTPERNSNTGSGWRMRAVFGITPTTTKPCRWKEACTGH